MCGRIELRSEFKEDQISRQRKNKIKGLGTPSNLDGTS